MKKQALICLALLCLTSIHTKAQSTGSNVVYQDTLILNISQNAKVIFTGNDLKDMVKYKKADSLKILFVNDFKRALQNETFPTESKTVHYFVHPNGKRRIKAENTEFQDSFLDVEKEIQSMSLNLPSYNYIIHDVATGYQLQVYLSSPEFIDELNKVNLNDAILSVASEKKRLRKSYSIGFQYENEQWTKLPPHLKKSILLETDPTIGVAVLGNRLSPELSLEFCYVFTDKYSLPGVKIGFALRNYLLTEYANKEFYNFYLVESYNINIRANLRDANSARNSWFGMEFGMIEANGGFLHKNYKFGFIYGLKSFQVGFDFMSPNWSFKSDNDDLLFGFSVRFSL